MPSKIRTHRLPPPQTKPKSRNHLPAVPRIHDPPKPKSRHHRPAVPRIHDLAEGVAVVGAVCPDVHGVVADLGRKFRIAVLWETIRESDSSEMMIILGAVLGGI